MLYLLHIFICLCLLHCVACLGVGGERFLSIFVPFYNQFSQVNLSPMFLPIINYDETPHVQAQGSRSKTVGTGTAAAQHWSDFEEISHIQGLRRSPSKMVGRVKSHLESNPIPARDAQSTQTYLVHTKTQRSHRTIFGYLLRKMFNWF